MFFLKKPSICNSANVKITTDFLTKTLVIVLVVFPIFWKFCNSDPYKQIYLGQFSLVFSSAKWERSLSYLQTGVKFINACKIIHVDVSVYDIFSQCVCRLRFRLVTIIEVFRSFNAMCLKSEVLIIFLLR